MSVTRKAPEGITWKSNKYSYSVRAWEVTTPSHTPNTRRVIFKKHASPQSPVRVELHGQTGDLARMFMEIAAALIGLDGSEPEDETPTFITQTRYP